MDGIRRSNIFFLALALAAAAPPALRAEVSGCRHQRLAAFLLENSYGEALKENDACVAYFRRERGRKGDLLEEATRAQAAYWLLNRAELKAVLGEKEAAAADLQAARADIQEQFPNGSTTRSIIEAQAGLAEAFLLEKSGEPEKAGAAYRGVLGANDPAQALDNAAPAEAAARLALMALDQGGYDEARSLLAGKLAPTPTSEYVRGALEDRLGRRPEAAEAYHRSLELMRAQAKGNPTTFMFYAEHARVEKAQTDLATELEP